MKYRTQKYEWVFVTHAHFYTLTFPSSQYQEIIALLLKRLLMKLGRTSYSLE